ERAALSIMRQSDSRTSTFPARAGGGVVAAGGASAVAGGGVALLSAGAAGVVAAGGDGASLPAGGGAIVLAGGAGGGGAAAGGGGGVAEGAGVWDCCGRAGAAANSISAMMAMRAMRDNEKAAAIVSRQHTSAGQSREARATVMVGLYGRSSLPGLTRQSIRLR